MRSLLGLVALVALVSGGGHKKKMIGLPVMGWSSWNQLGCLHLTEQQVLTQAIALNSSGLRQLGYTLIALDDCWQAPSRNQSTGALEADHQRFPGGMKALSTKLHSLGFKLGLYTCAGHYTCQLRPGALGNECNDAVQYASWGVDVLKEDWCFTSGFQVASLSPEKQYSSMRSCLDQQGERGSAVALATCDWGVGDPWTWAGKNAHAIMWRTAPDMLDSYQSLTDTVDMQLGLHRFAEEQGGVNDPDGLWAGADGMTSVEYKTQFLLWSMLAAPLIASNDISIIDNTTLGLLSSTAVLRINQDPLVASGTLIHWTGGMQTWARTLAGGARAVLFWNRDGATALSVAAVTWEELGIPAAVDVCHVIDAFSGAAIPQTGDRRVLFNDTIKQHDTVLLRVDCEARAGDKAAMDGWRPSIAPGWALLGATKRAAAMVGWIATQETQNFWVGFFQGATEQLPFGQGLIECMPELFSRSIELQRAWQAFTHSWGSGTASGAKALWNLLQNLAQEVLHGAEVCRAPLLYGRLKVLLDELSHPLAGWKELVLHIFQHAGSIIQLSTEALSQWKANIVGSSGNAIGQIFVILSQNSTLLSSGSRIAIPVDHR